ncbi:DUF3027 domain-containing protein [Curtobacterium sp. MCBD17_032]|uniref:DUF3027 domain-containing protein n=1 Tax=Curtobacterium sp. MCBD17_032 TaxID=2175659 RepID=UPI000DA8ACE3|nr:DUF3027 domain-containing protein [Curtobacterium sp. MCBD17_032]PZE81731.1 DUF3027 domain-containing protein [Curtobacterium sp. MCBD17_032]
MTTDLTELARGALLEITPEATVGSPVGTVEEGDGVVSVLFANRMPGYPGWRWTVSIAQVEGDEPTVLEVELMPGDGSLLAPEWVPWSERLAEYRAAQDDEESDEDDEESDDEDDEDDFDDESDDDESDDDEDDDDSDDGDDDSDDGDESDEDEDEDEDEDDDEDEDQPAAPPARTRGRRRTRRVRPVDPDDDLDLDQLDAGETDPGFHRS